MGLMIKGPPSQGYHHFPHEKSKKTCQGATVAPWCFHGLKWEPPVAADRCHRRQLSPLIRADGDVDAPLMEENPANQLRYVVYPIIYKVLGYIPGGWPWDF